MLTALLIRCMPRQDGMLRRKLLKDLDAPGSQINVLQCTEVEGQSMLACAETSPVSC